MLSKCLSLSCKCKLLIISIFTPQSSRSSLPTNLNATLLRHLCLHRPPSYILPLSHVHQLAPTLDLLHNQVIHNHNFTVIITTSFTQLKSHNLGNMQPLSTIWQSYPQSFEDSVLPYLSLFTSPCQPTRLNSLPLSAATNNMNGMEYLPPRSGRVSCSCNL